MSLLPRAIVTACLLVLLSPAPALAGWDLLLFLGRVYPTLEDRLRFRIPAPSAPGVNVTTVGEPQIQADGGLTVGGALTVEAGVLGLEGRLDSMNMAFDVTGARFDLAGAAPPITGLTGNITLTDGRLDLARMHVLSLNLRVRTPGPVGLVFSGGVSYLPRFTVNGSVPVSVGVDTPLGTLMAAAGLALEAAPDESGHRVGLNGGIGLRVGGGRFAFVGEARAFAFGEYELNLVVQDQLGLLDQIGSSFGAVRVRPVIVTAQVGLLVSF